MTEKKREKRVGLFVRHTYFVKYELINLYIETNNYLCASNLIERIITLLFQVDCSRCLKEKI